MACNSFLIRVHGRVLSWCLCRVSAAEVLEVRFLPRCFFLARCSQAQSLLRCRSALHTLRLLLRSVCWQSRHSVCVWKSLGSGFSSTQFNTLKCIKITNRMLVSVQLRPASAFTPRCIFFPASLSLTLYLSLSLSSLQMMERYGSGRTLLTRRIRRWWRRGRVSPICCPLPEVSPPSARTVKTNALYYCVTNPSAVPPIPQNHKLSQSIPVIRPHCSAYREGLRGGFFSP